VLGNSDSGGGAGDRWLGWGWSGRRDAAVGASRHRWSVDYRWWWHPELGVGLSGGERRCPEIKEVRAARRQGHRIDCGRWVGMEEWRWRSQARMEV
jgi:hypothetical protein